MSRSLRPRRARLNYAALFDRGDEEGNEGLPQPKDPILEPEAGSGSEFAPEDNAAPSPADEVLSLDSDDASMHDGEASELEDAAPDDVLRYPEDCPSTAIPSSGQSAKRKRPNTQAPGAPRTGTSLQLAPGLSRPSNRKMYTLPSVPSHNRQRMIPLHRRYTPSQRLAEPPAPFGLKPVGLVSTNSGTGTAEVVDRVAKSWAYNVGPGPLWELLEDRAWFKEERDAPSGEEANRRPRVYEDVQVGEVDLLSDEQARAYLPHQASDPTQPPNPLPCWFGPHDKQERREMSMFDALEMSKVHPGTNAHVFHAGAPVWALDWCPTHPNDRDALSNSHYLAVGPLTSQTDSPDIGRKCPSRTPACIQIWSLTRKDSPADEAAYDTGSAMTCEMVLCIEGGPAFDLKWCPLPSADEMTEQRSESRVRKLGLLGGTFEDGSLAIYCVPYPVDVKHTIHHGSSAVFIKVAPILRIELEETSCWALDWADSELLAVGCTNGSIAVYNVAEALRSGNGSGLLPTHYVSVHQSAIRALCWLRIPRTDAEGAPLPAHPTVIASGGYDGVECLTDIREPCGNVMNRTRDVINCVAFSPYAGGPVAIDHENSVKVYSVSPTMLGRGHILMEPGGPVWHVAVSDYHPHVAVGSANGTCMTTNMFRGTRRGGAVPFLAHTVYQLDYSRTHDEYRMLDRFLPQETHDRPTTTRKRQQGAAIPEVPVGSGAWHPGVGVQRVAWHSGAGLSGASLLASATGCGLCRIDWLVGRWARGRVPYGGVEGIRGEEAIRSR